jgi:hypothetical protein
MVQMQVSVPRIVELPVELRTSIESEVRVPLKSPSSVEAETMWYSSVPPACPSGVIESSTTGAFYGPLAALDWPLTDRRQDRSGMQAVFEWAIVGIALLIGAGAALLGVGVLLVALNRRAGRKEGLIDLPGLDHRG